jgi:iron complex transport system ATP-binding protein
LFTSLEADIQEAAFVSIIGPNGSGKTTLLRHMLRLLPKPGGTVCIHGKDVHTYSQRSFAHTVSYVPQQGLLEYDFTVKDFVAMGRYSHVGRFSLLDSKDHSIIDESLERMGISHLQGRLATELSGGEYQRMVIARALAQQAGIIMLDEPVSHLDPRNQRDILRLLRSLVDEHADTVVCVLHDLNAVAAFSDKIIMLDHGKVAAYGTPEEVLTTTLIRQVYHIEVDILRQEGQNHTIIPRWR